MRAPIVFDRWFLLAFSIFVTSSCSVGYAFGIYTPLLKQAPYGYSQ
eukprot:gene5312-5348_t